MADSQVPPPALSADEVAGFTGFVVHELNNILTVILGHAGRLCEASPAPDDAPAALAEIEQAVEEAGDLLAQLGDATTPRRLQVSTVDVSEVATALDGRLRHLLGADVAFHLTTAPPGCAVARVDRNALERTILRLATHAGRGLPDGGTVRAEVHARSATDDWPVDLIMRVSGPVVDLTGSTSAFLFLQAIAAQSGGRLRVDLASALGVISLRLPGTDVDRLSMTACTNT